MPIELQVRDVRKYGGKGAGSNERSSNRNWQQRGPEPCGSGFSDSLIAS